MTPTSSASSSSHRIALRARANQHFVYAGRSLLVVNLDGQVSGAGTEGFYFENTRLLCRDELCVDGRPVRAIAASPVGGNGFLAYYLVPGGACIPKEAIFLDVARTLGDGLRSELRVQNYHRQDNARFELAVHLAADFADSEEAETGKRQQTGPVETVWDADRQELGFRYCHPQIDRAVSIRVEAPGPARWEDGALRFTLDLPPHRPMTIALVVEPIFDEKRIDAPRQVFAPVATRDGRARRQLAVEIARLSSTNRTVARAWQTATEDLASLPLGLESGPAAPIAGLPLYQQFFGRDTLTTGWQALLATPTLLRDSLRAVAATQGTRIDDWRDEEPGKLIHQARRGPLSVLGVDPYLAYYGDYATPPDFLIMVGQYLLWTNDRATVRQLLPTALKAAAWLDHYGDLDGDGFIEYVTRSEHGEKNQGWKDSNDAIVDERGETVANPIATCELQAYWYVGLRQAAWAFLLLGEVGEALRLRRQAAVLKRRFDAAFWMEDEGFYALALGPDKRPVRTIASNNGHLLACGIVPRTKAARVARRLMQPDLFSGWAVRTLSDQHPSFNPFSYHLGSVWPVENGTFAFGFARYGLWEELWRLAEGIFAATELFVGNRLPEALGGLPRDARHPHPGIYPWSNEPQAWSASMIVVVVQALLGLRPLAPLGVLLVDPHLPPWLPDLRLEGLRVGAARLDLAFERQPDGETGFRVTRQAGAVRVLRQPPPDAPGATLLGRLATLRLTWGG